MESKNKLAAFLKFLVAMQYKPSYTFNLFFLSQSPPSSNKLQSVKKYTVKYHDWLPCEPNDRMELTNKDRAYFFALSMDFEMRSKSM